MVEKLSMRPFSLSVLRYYFSVFIRRMIYIFSRLCYRPLSLTEIFLLHDMKKENAVLCSQYGVIREQLYDPPFLNSLSTTYEHEGL